MAMAIDETVICCNVSSFVTFGVGFGLTPGVLWKKAPRAIRAMRGKTLQTAPFKGISTVLWVHQKLPQSTVSQAFQSNKSYESKAGCNRTPATVLWVPLRTFICVQKSVTDCMSFVVMLYRKSSSILWRRGVPLPLSPVRSLINKEI